MTTESNINFTHSKTLAFDNYSRPFTDTTLTTDIASGLSATVISKCNYNANGIMFKLTDNNNVTLWQLNSANEKMQTLTAVLGNGIAINNVYDADNYYQSQRQTKGTIDILYNTYNFNAIKGLLVNRQNIKLATNEVFTFDNLDRLLSWTNPSNNLVETQTYDNRGRIDVNKVGTYRYTNAATAGLYRKTSINLTTDATTYYTTKPLQTATYTMFKSPMTINDSSLGATNFTYNSHLSRMKMQYGWTSSLVVAPTVRVGSTTTSSTSTSPTTAIAAIPQPTGSYNKTKFYTDDGSTEIIKADGKIRIITYIAGTAYSAPLYNEKVKTTSGGAITDNNYYLHRDYLGSIVAISNQAGVAIERRQFDAWGNLAKLEKNGVGIAMPTTNGGLEALMVLDRGYTSHEHLAEVGLVQMNGRLYDPKLHTFLMPDNFVQQPENTQSYNRYAYCINNPLKYTDPSGELFGLDDLAAAIIIGAFISASVYTITCLRSGQSFSWSGLATATFIGAASAAVTFGIGSGASSMFTQAATGFWQGAVQGAIVGAITGAGGAIVNGIFNGGNITLKEVLGGALIGGAIGAITGGIKGGINAQNSGKEFWSGKSKWMEIKIGGGQPITIGDKIDFSDPRWDVDEKMNLKQYNQISQNDCSVACKLSVDNNFSASNQTSINDSWFNQAQKSKAGLGINEIFDNYKGAGYQINDFGFSDIRSGVNFQPNTALPWMVNEMKANHVVQLGWRPGNLFGHASLVKQVVYRSDFSEFRIYLMNPGASGGMIAAKSFNNIFQIFSIWK